MKFRYQPNFIFPPVVFIPGKSPHPNRSGGYREGMTDPTAPPLDPKEPGKNEAYRIAIDLFNHHYYWEAHVYFEALWNAHARVGLEASFLKVLVKLSAAGVKSQTKNLNARNEQLNHTRELLSELINEVGLSWLGFDLPTLQHQIAEQILSDAFLLELKPQIGRAHV